MAEKHYPLKVAVPGLLTALGTYEMVRVYRSPAVDTGSQMYAPVKRFIEANELVLAESGTEADPDMVGGKSISSWYVTAANRHVLAQAGQL